MGRGVGGYHRISIGWGFIRSEGVCPVGGGGGGGENIDSRSLRIRLRQVMANGELSKLYCLRNIIKKKKKTETNEIAYVGNAEHMKKVIKTKFYP